MFLEIRVKSICWIIFSYFEFGNLDWLIRKQTTVEKLIEGGEDREARDVGVSRTVEELQSFFGAIRIHLSVFILPLLLIQWNSENPNAAV